MRGGLLVLYKLPNSKINLPSGWSKVSTYQLLYNLGCPVMKSILLTDSNALSESIINEIKDYLQSEQATLRFQYIKPNSNPIRGGSLVTLDVESLSKYISEEYILWFMTPLDRLKNKYAINIGYNKHSEQIIYEIVGQGFDASDLNRGDINPHQTIYFNPAYDRGYYNSLLYRINVEIIKYDDYSNSIIERTAKLSRMGISISEDTFCHQFTPLPFSIIEKLDKYTTNILEYFKYNENVNISLSISENYKIFFWDIQTFENKYETFKEK